MSTTISLDMLDGSNNFTPQTIDDAILVLKSRITPCDIAKDIYEAIQILANKVENDKWIPVTDHLPDNRICGKYLATLKNGHVSLAHYGEYEYDREPKDRFYFFSGKEQRFFSENNPVIAWKEEPEGYYKQDNIVSD